ncbi:ABC transporter permease [Blastococcus sp. URHD0036]|uniref:ABC transporter permease n=1 Tax=Blastococcus sp. URHD0036 TaxID=1380356 RepID=UPI0012DCFD6D|nr:ABC transporter permease [Blastococcus sp. URHD0036]
MPAGLQPPPGPADQSVEEQRSAGSPVRAGLRGIVLPALVAVAIGTLLIVVYLAAFPAAEPHDLPVGVVGPAPQVAELQATLERDRPGVLELERLPSASAAERAVTSGDLYAALVLDGSAPQLLVAGAHGQAVTQDLTDALGPVAGGGLQVSDVAPLADGDSRGRAIDHTAFGVVLGGFLFGITSYQVAPQLRLRLRLASAVLFAGVAGLVAASLSVVAFDAVPAGFWTVGGLVALLALACGAASALALRLLGAVGTFVATAVLLTVGAATSTGSFPAEYLPGWLAPLADVLPPGVAVQALRGTAYLSGHAVAHGVVVLALWSAVPFLVVGALDAVSRRRSPA